MSTDVKGYAKEVLGGYSDSLNALKKRYDSVILEIDRKHDLKKNEINTEARRKKSESDAANKISLQNTKESMLGKGLSRSGASVQADIDHNLAGKYAMAKIDSDASDERTANELARVDAKESARRDYILGVADIEKARNSAYIDQLNRDRDYEAERDDEAYDRFADNRDFEAERDDEKHDRYVENRAYEAERDDEKHDRYVENRAYEAERDDEKYDRFADNRDYQAERYDEKYDRFADNRDYQAERDDERYDRYADSRDYAAERDDEAYDRNADKRDYIADRYDEVYDRYADTRDFEAEHGNVESGEIELGITPQNLVDKIRSVYNSKKYSTEEKKKEAIRSVIDTVIKDESLSAEYRYEVKVYATAIGLY